MKGPPRHLQGERTANDMSLVVGVPLCLTRRLISWFLCLGEDEVKEFREPGPLQNVRFDGLLR